MTDCANIARAPPHYREGGSGTPLFNGIIAKDYALVDDITNTDSALMVEYAGSN